jgi:hypothetical protein
MSHRTIVLFICLALGTLGAGLRFYRLGDWPFHGDELAAIEEAQSLVEKHDGPLTAQKDRLPRLIPLGYFILYIDHELFGRDEFGSRVLTAILGTLHVLLVFFFLDRTLGRVPALATALLIALWPEHLYRSQENRYYMMATVCASLAMLWGALAVQRRSFVWTIAACVAAFAAVLAHTLQGLLFAGLFVAILAAGWLVADRRILRLLSVVVVAGLLSVAFFAWYLLPLIRGWNSGETWGYSLSHSVMASVSQLGWPIALLALLGLLTVGRWNREQAGYWIAWSVLWATASVVLPFLVSYHPGYVFPLTLGVFVLAGQAIAVVYEALRPQYALAACCWVGMTCLFNLPSVVSHYADGSRGDLRSAGEFVTQNWQPGDRVAAFSPTLLRHYVAPGIDPIGLKSSDSVTHLRKLGRSPERLWVVVHSSRGGKPENLADWLGKHCTLEMSRRSRRIDYHENVTEVFLYEPLQAVARH